MIIMYNEHSYIYIFMYVYSITIKNKLIYITEQYVNTIATDKSFI